jgi:hypothetical protein
MTSYQSEAPPPHSCLPSLIGTSTTEITWIKSKVMARTERKKVPTDGGDGFYFTNQPKQQEGRKRDDKTCEVQMKKREKKLV